MSYYCSIQQQRSSFSCPAMKERHIINRDVLSLILSLKSFLFVSFLNFFPWCISWSRFSFTYITPHYEPSSFSCRFTPRLSLFKMKLISYDVFFRYDGYLSVVFLRLFLFCVLLLRRDSFPFEAGRMLDPPNGIRKCGDWQ